jgi:hypothetical protein
MPNEELSDLAILAAVADARGFTSAHNINGEAVVIESDPNAKSRATHEPAGLREIKRSFHDGHSLMHGASVSMRKKPCARVGLYRRAAARLGWGARKKRA